MFSHAAYLEIGSLKSGLENMKKSGYCKLKTLVVTLDVIFLIRLLCVEISTKQVNVFVTTIIIEKQTIRGSGRWQVGPGLRQHNVHKYCASAHDVWVVCRPPGHTAHTTVHTVVDIASVATPIDPTIHPSIHCHLVDPLSPINKPANIDRLCLSSIIRHSAAPRRSELPVVNRVSLPRLSFVTFHCWYCDSAITELLHAVDESVASEEKWYDSEICFIWRANEVKCWANEPWRW